MRVIKELRFLLRYCYWRTNQCVFIHVPKAAGTSVCKAVYGRTLGHYSAEHLSHKAPGLFNNSYKFSFVRNPYTRLLSAYKFAKQGRTADMGMHMPEQYQIPEFDTFDTFVREWLVHQDLDKIDNVFRLQSSYLYIDQDLAVDFLGKYESIDQDFSVVASHLGRQLTLPKANSTAPDRANLSVYTDELQALVYSLYKLDFVNFDYGYGIP